MSGGGPKERGRKGTDSKFVWAPAYGEACVYVYVCVCLSEREGGVGAVSNPACSLKFGTSIKSPNDKI